MKIEVIEEIIILESTKLAIVLASGGESQYQMIYREAAGVSWDTDLKAFKSTIKKDDMSYSNWAKHIKQITENFGIKLSPSRNIKFTNVSDSIREEMTFIFDIN
jgi:hypothetical protein